MDPLDGAFCPHCHKAVTKFTGYVLIRFDDVDPVQYTWWHPRCAELCFDEVKDEPPKPGK